MNRRRAFEWMMCRRNLRDEMQEDGEERDKSKCWMISAEREKAGLCPATDCFPSGFWSSYVGLRKECFNGCALAFLSTAAVAPSCHPSIAVPPWTGGVLGTGRLAPLVG